MARRTNVTLAATLVVALAIAGWFGYRYVEHRDADQTNAQAVSAARQAMKNFMEVNQSTLDRDLQRVADAATGDFKSEFERDRAQLKKAYTEKKVQAHGDVLDAAVDTKGSDDDSVRVLLVVDQNVKSGPTPQLRHYRIQVDMAADGDRWLVSSLSFVS